MDLSALAAGCIVRPKAAPLGPFAVIPAGEGQVGSAGPVQRWDGSEYSEHPANGPPRPVRVPRPFLMGCGPVTVEDFREVCPEVFDADPPVFVLAPSLKVEDPWRVAPFSRVNGREGIPVVGLSWWEAATFCWRLGQRWGLSARLPTEYEWEYAARAGARTVYSWGDDPKAGLAFAWTKRNSNMTVQPVGRLAPNAWGLYDTAGNVWEWCGDAFDGQRAGGPLQRSIRGGAAFTEPTAVRAAHRWGQDPDQRNAFLGFRVLVEADDGVGG
jgi:formylglycine-generating enzyme required for sulfatase activity